MLKKTCLGSLLITMAALLFNCTSPVMQIRRDSPLSKEVFIVNSNTKNVEVGKRYTVYRKEIIYTTSASVSHTGHGNHIHDMGNTHTAKKMVGVVEVTSIIDEKTLSAVVVIGDIQDGDVVE